MTCLLRNWLQIALFCGAGLLLYSCMSMTNSAPNALADAGADVAKTGICNRTRQVQEAILKVTKPKQCAKVDRNNLRNVTTLDLSEGSIRKLQRRDFRNLGNLRYLNLSDNQLEALPKGIFKGLGNLEELNLSNNPLKKLPKGIFKDVNNLQAVLPCNSLKKISIHVSGGRNINFTCR